MTETRGADVIAQRLARVGCRFAFGIPGGEVLALVDALSRAGLRVVTARHETAAGFMAEGTWHATGAPGVLVATLGPGVANVVNVVANAQQDRVPLVVLTGCIDAADMGYTHQIFDHRAVLGPLVKSSVTLSADAIALTIDDAIALALADPPGPVHVDIPISISSAPSVAPASPLARGRSRVAPNERVLPAARAAIRSAERPLVIVGLEVLFQNADAALADFLRATEAPCITTYKAKGLVDETSAQSLGAAGLSPRADALLLPLVRAADLVLLAGYDPIEMRRGWRKPFAETTRVIELASTTPSHRMHHATDLFVGDIAAHLRALTPPAAATARAVWPDGQPGTTRAALLAAFAPERDTFGPLAIAHALRSALPADAVVTVDTGAHRIALAQAFACTAPRTMLQSSGLCTMGCAVPLAIGRKLAEPGRPVVAVVGDGGLDMTLGELATARDLGVGLVIVVIDDASLALIEMKQRAEGYPNVAVDTGRTRYADVATALGGVGVVAKSAMELVAAVTEGLAKRGTFTLIHCPIERGAYDGRI